MLLEKYSLLSCGQFVNKLDRSSLRLKKFIKEHALDKFIGAKKNVKQS